MWLSLHTDYIRLYKSPENTHELMAHLSPHMQVPGWIIYTRHGCVIFPDGVAMQGLVLRLPGGYLHATAVVILCLYHASLMLLL